jgi:2-keto-4-pentenoate hydratase/2-oxohepta-3-ene-1,7-dioic acid hydratase in catechol pathway
MKLATFHDGQTVRVGLVDMDRERIFPLDVALGSCASDLAVLVERFEEVRGALGPVGEGRPLASVKLLAPFPRPRRNVFCVGKNYHEHAKEFAKSGFDATAREVVPEAPVVFSKPPSAVIGPGDPIPSYLDPTNSVDYEGELAVVIGRGGRGIKRSEALGHVFGYTIVNDVTARTLQQRHRQWILGKGIDGFCPMGPVITTADEVPDPAALRVRTWVNDELRQDETAASLIFDIPMLIETISAGITLEPGDVIATGTPYGVGIGFNPPKFLKPGDTVRIEIAGIGILENPVA